MAEAHEIPDWRRRLVALREAQGTDGALAASAAPHPSRDPAALHGPTQPAAPAVDRSPVPQGRPPRTALRILDDPPARPSGTTARGEPVPGDRIPARAAPRRTPRPAAPLVSGARTRGSRRVRIALRATATVGSAIGITAAVLVYGRSLDDDRQATAAASEPLASFDVEPLGVGRPATPPVTVATGAGDRVGAQRSAPQTRERAVVLAVVRTPDSASATALGDRLTSLFGSERTLTDVEPGEPGDGIRGVIVLDALDLFVPGTDELTLDGRLDLVAVAALLRTFRGAWVDVVGHTDSVGTAGRNDELSTDWADAAAALIRTETAGAVSVHPTGRGAGEPLTDNETADGRRRNNRIEIVFHDPEREELTSSGPR